MDLLDLTSGLVHLVLFTALAGLALRLTWNHRATLPFQTKLFFWALVIRFGVSLFLYQAGGIRLIKDEDGGGWLAGVGLAKNWESQGHSFLEAPFLFLRAYGDFHHGYFYLLGSIFLATGIPSRLAAAALSGVCGALTVVITYRLARSLFSEAVARRAGWLACFFPSLIVWSAQTLKEPVVILLETLALYGCVRLCKHGVSLRHLLLVGVVCVLLYPFRFYAAVIAVGTVLITLLLPRFGASNSWFRKAVAAGLLILGVIVLLGGQVPREMEQQRFDLDYIQAIREGAALGQGSGVKVDADLHTPGGLGLAVLVGALHLLLAPFPWQWGESLRMALVVPEVVIWWGLLLYGVLPGLRHALRNRFQDVLPLLLFIVGMGLVYSLTFGNTGLIYRQRAQLLPWLLVFAAVGMELRRLRRVRGQAAGPESAPPRRRDPDGPQRDLPGCTPASPNLSSR
jgi:hypothetical protein